MENLDRPVTSKEHKPVTSKLPTRKAQAQRTSLDNRAKRLKKNEQFFTSFHKTEKEETLPNSESSIILILQPKASQENHRLASTVNTEAEISHTALVKQSHNMQRPHAGILGCIAGTQGWPSRRLTEHTLSTGKRSIQSSQETQKKHRVCAEHLLSFWASRRWVCARQRHCAQPRDRPAPSLQGASWGQHSTQVVTHRWGGGFSTSCTAPQAHASFPFTDFALYPFAVQSQSCDSVPSLGPHRITKLRGGPGAL